MLGSRLSAPGGERALHLSSPQFSFLLRYFIEIAKLIGSVLLIPELDDQAISRRDVAVGRNHVFFRFRQFFLVELTGVFVGPPDECLEGPPLSALTWSALFLSVPLLLR